MKNRNDDKKIELNNTLDNWDVIYDKLYPKSKIYKIKSFVFWNTIKIISMLIVTSVTVLIILFMAITLINYFQPEYNEPKILSDSIYSNQYDLKIEDITLTDLERDK